MLTVMSVTLDERERSLLETTYQRYRDAMFDAAYSIVQNSYDAEDVIQEVFLKLATKYMPTLSRLSQDSIDFYYLLTATRNTALNFYKRAHDINETLVEPNTLENIPLSDNFFVDQLDSFDSSFLAEKIRMLNPIYQDVLLQRFVLNLSVKEIADENHVPLYTVKKRLFRAKQMLRNICLEDKRSE